MVYSIKNLIDRSLSDKLLEKLIEQDGKFEQYAPELEEAEQMLNRHNEQYTDIFSG